RRSSGRGGTGDRDGPPRSSCRGRGNRRPNCDCSRTGGQRETEGRFAMSEDQGQLAATAALEGDRYLTLGNLPEALAAYERAVKRAPRQIAYRYKRALAKARAGMLTEARTELEVLVELEPGHTAYRVALERLQRQERAALDSQARQGDVAVPADHR